MRALFLCLLLAAACDKPSPNACEKAIDNIDKINGLQPNPERRAAAVRTCRARSSEARVNCMIAAKSKEDLDKCGTD